MVVARSTEAATLGKNWRKIIEGGRKRIPVIIPRHARGRKGATFRARAVSNPQLMLTLIRGSIMRFATILFLAPFGFGNLPAQPALSERIDSVMKAAEQAGFSGLGRLEH